MSNKPEQHHHQQQTKRYARARTRDSVQIAGYNSLTNTVRLAAKRKPGEAPKLSSGAQAESIEATPPGLRVVTAKGVTLIPWSNVLDADEVA